MLSNFRKTFVIFNHKFVVAKYTTLKRSVRLTETLHCKLPDMHIIIVVPIQIMRMPMLQLSQKYTSLY